MLSVKASIIHTGRKVFENGCLNWQDGTIAGISAPPRGDVAGRYPVVTPAFIDPHCHIGMERAGEPSAEGEANEKMESIVVLADALDSVQMDDDSFRESIEAGVLYSCVVPGSGNILGGRSAVLRNYAATTSDALVGRAGIKAAVGYNPMSTREWKGKRPYTRMGAMALLREKLHEVKDKILQGKDRKKNGEKEFSREDEVLRDVLLGEEILRVHVHKSDDMESVLRLTDEFRETDPRFRMRLSMEHAGDVHSPEIYRKLKERSIPVVYGPMDSFPYKVELKHESWRNLKHLLDSGVEYGLMTDHPVILQRMLFHQLRWFLRCGLDKDRAIQVVTRQNARILGLDPFLGTLEEGKWASFVCWNGDPFDLSSYPVAVYGEGRLLFSEDRSAGA